MFRLDHWELSSARGAVAQVTELLPSDLQTGWAGWVPTGFVLWETCVNPVSSQVWLPQESGRPQTCKQMCAWKWVRQRSQLWHPQILYIIIFNKAVSKKVTNKSHLIPPKSGESWSSWYSLSTGHKVGSNDLTHCCFGARSTSWLRLLKPSQHTVSHLWFLRWNFPWPYWEKCEMCEMHGNSWKFDFHHSGYVPFSPCLCNSELFKLSCYPLHLFLILFNWQWLQPRIFVRARANRPIRRSLSFFEVWQKPHLKPARRLNKLTVAPCDCRNETDLSPLQEERIQLCKKAEVAEMLLIEQENRQEKMCTYTWDTMVDLESLWISSISRAILRYLLPGPTISPKALSSTGLQPGQTLLYAAKETHSQTPLGKI